MTEKHTMSAEAARSFDGHSEAHAAFLAAAADERGCECRAYEDWFTYRRWRAQGMQVQKGEHGVKLSVYVRKTQTDDEGNEKPVTFPKRTTVFCRCQVKAATAH